MDNVNIMAVSKQAQTELRSEIANMPVWLRRSIGRADEISAVQRIVGSPVVSAMLSVWALV